MGFRFRNLNPIYRVCITRFCSNTQVLSCSNSLAQHPWVVLSQIHPVYGIPRRWHGGHSHHRGGDYNHGSGEESEKIFKLGLASDVVLATGKALTGYLSGSTAIIADAAHSISDVVLSGVALVSFKVANAPKDKEHPYGHGKFETLGALGISCMLLATGGGIAWHALDLLHGLMLADHQILNQSLIQDHDHGHHHVGHHHGIDMNYPILALSVTIMSISIKEGLYWITKRAGERTNSGLMIANAWHHRADAISSVVTLVGVGGAILGIKFLDPLAGVVVSGMILKAGLETGVLELVDAAIPSKHLDPVKQTILQVEGVKGCHHLRGRRAGSSLYVDVNIEVDPFCSVSAAHDIGEDVRHQIHKSHPEVAEVFIHIDPATSQISSTVNDQQESLKRTTCEKSDSVKENDIEAAVSNIITERFQLNMVVEHIIRHSLQGKVLLQIEVSMPPSMFIRDAMEVAKKAEEEILKAHPDIVHVSIQLRLGRPIPQFNDNNE
ncbi:metal tolerance protein 2 isoform X2 [Humulus lupulus]|uniref:metal tolerance protein 2 isoform X2 n=1 Tax=Humulus lupulus TaxID=3486 RepID=UPI002B41612B|nr:metal tolerance protein 2 isoform X2 [Humulus lupulus]